MFRNTHTSSINTNSAKPVTPAEALNAALIAGIFCAGLWSLAHWFFISPPDPASTGAAGAQSATILTMPPLLGLIVVLSSGICLLWLARIFVKRTKQQKHTTPDGQNPPGQSRSFSPEQQAKLMESLEEGIVLIDDRGRCGFVNHAFAAAYGYEKESDVIGRHWHDFYQEQEWHRIEKDMKSSFAKTGVWRGKALGIRQDESRFFQDVSFATMRDGGMICIVKDMSHSVETQETLNARLAAIEASMDGIALIDQDGHIMYMNNAMAELHFIRPAARDSYTGKSWRNLYSESGAQEIEDEILSSVRQIGKWRGEHQLHCQNGQSVWAESSLTRLSKGTVIHIARNIETRKKNEQDRRNLQDQLFQAQKMESIGRLAAGLSHDFNNILAAMTGYAEFLIEDLADRPDLQNFAERIYEAGESGKALLTQMGDFSQRREKAHEIVDVAEIFLEAQSILDASFPKTVQVKAHSDLTCAPVLANGSQIEQTIMNLCVNAKDSLPDEKGTLELSLQKGTPCELPVRRYLVIRSDDMLPMGQAVRLKEIAGKTWLLAGYIHERQTYLHIRIADNGHGMCKTVMEHIFEPFFTTKSSSHGTGLGLAAVQGVVLGHKGAIAVESKENEGTTFHLFLPLEEQEQKSAQASNDTTTGQPDAAFEPEGPGRPEKDRLILVVDDQESVREMMVQRLKRLGYRTQSCASAMDAIDVIREKQGCFDLIVSDQNMPEMTGLDLASQIEEDFPDLPLILVSGYTASALEDLSGKSNTIKAVVRKPVSSKALQQKIQMVLNQTRQAA